MAKQKTAIVTNLAPGAVDLEWRDDTPVLVFTELRYDRELRRRRRLIVKVALTTFGAAHVARQLHEIHGAHVRRADHLARALKAA